MSVTIKTEIIINDEEEEIVDDPEFIMDFDVEETPDSPEMVVNSPISLSNSLADACCPYCQLTLRNNKELDMHVKAFHPNDQPTLSIGLDSDEENVDDPGYPPIIPYEPRASTRSVAYNSFNNLNKQTKNYFCSQCYFYTEQVTAIYEHMEKNKHISQYKCNYCDKYFAFIYMIDNHHKSCHKDDEPAYSEFSQGKMRKECRFICNLCSGNEKTVFDVQEHNKKMHKGSMKQFGYFIELDNKLGRPELLEKPMAPNCFEPNAFTAAQTDARKNAPIRTPIHNQTLGKITPKVTQLFYSCNMCKATFETHSQFREHRLNKHEDEHIEDFMVSQMKNGPLIDVNKLPKYYCIECSVVHYTTSEMKEHYKIHNKTNSPFQYITQTQGVEPKVTEEATYKCSECAMFPDTLLEMKTHWGENHPNKVFKVMKLYTETPSRNYPCPHCDNFYYYKLMLQLHIEHKHTGVDASSVVDTVVPRIVEPIKNNRIETRPAPNRASSYQHYQSPIIAGHKERTNGNVVPIPVANKYQCLYCTLCHEVFQELKDHHIKQHPTFTWLYIYVRSLNSGTVEQISSEELIYKCTFCELDFGKNMPGLTNHYKEHHSKLPFKYKVAKGIDGFTSWQEHMPEKVSLTVKDLSSNIKKEIKEDVKPDIKKLNAQMAPTSRTRTPKTPVIKPTTPRGRGRPRKLDKLVPEEIEMGVSHYGKKPKYDDLDDLKVRHVFNGVSTKIRYQSFSQVLKLNVKVKVDKMDGSF